MHEDEDDQGGSSKQVKGLNVQTVMENSNTKRVSKDVLTITTR